MFEIIAFLVVVGLVVFVSTLYVVQNKEELESKTPKGMVRQHKYRVKQLNRDFIKEMKKLHAMKEGTEDKLKGLTKEDLNARKHATSIVKINKMLEAIQKVKAQVEKGFEQIDEVTLVESEDEANKYINKCNEIFKQGDDSQLSNAINTFIENSFMCETRNTLTSQLDCIDVGDSDIQSVLDDAFKQN